MTGPARRFTPRQIEIARAVAREDGNYSAAALRLEVTPAAVSMAMARLAETLRLPGDRTRDGHMSLARAVIERVEDEPVELALVPSPPPTSTPSRADGPPTLPATCHPDRESFQLRLCRACYGERVRRSRESFAEERAVRLAERASIDEDLQGGRGTSRSGDHLGQALTFTHYTVLRIAARGLTMRQVADEMRISEQTVKNHLTAIYTRLGSRSLVGAFLALGWLTMPDADGPTVATLPQVDDARRAAASRIDEAVVHLTLIRSFLSDPE